MFRKVFGTVLPLVVGYAAHAALDVTMAAMLAMLMGYWGIPLTMAFTVQCLGLSMESAAIDFMLVLAPVALFLCGIWLFLWVASVRRVHAWLGRCFNALSGKWLSRD